MQPKEIPFAAQSYADPETGRRVTRLFPPEQKACHAYFTSTSYDADGRLVLSAEVEGRCQLCRADLRAGNLHVLTDLPDMALQRYCVSPARNLAVVMGKGRFVRVDLGTGECETIFTAPEGWTMHLPTVDAAGKRIAFSLVQKCPNLTASSRIYSTMSENFYLRPHSMIVTIDLDDNTPAVVWGETAWISHVLVNPVDPDTIVFCHEGGGLVDHRLWVVNAPVTRKKHARCLYTERFEEWLVHEYFLQDGTLGVQLTEYDPSDAQAFASKTIFNGVLFLHMDGSVAGKLKLPGRRSGHVQSNPDNTLLVADGYYPHPDSDAREGQKRMALNIPDGDRLRVEPLCRSGTSWRTQASHPHPIFSPDGRQVLFSAEVDGANSVFLVDL